MKIKTAILTATMTLLIPSLGFTATIAVKDFREILSFLSSATGVDPSDADISDYYNHGYTRLPKNGVVSEVKAPMVLTLTTLSSLFCKKMIEHDASLSDTSKRRAHKQVDFTKGADALTQDVRQSVINEYAALFWTRIPTQSEISSVQTLMNSAPSDVKSILLLGCTSMASSLDAFVN